MAHEHTHEHGDAAGSRQLAWTLALVVGYRRLTRGALTKDVFAAMRAFWFFVVGVWPVLYTLVYL